MLYKKKNLAFIILLNLTLNVVTGMAMAEQQTKTQDDMLLFDQGFFAQYNSVTLRDMIRVVPGGLTVLNNLNSNQQSRGLGSNGAPILINGKRMSGKSNDIGSQLRRTQASQIERIELIRGNAEGLDIRSQGVIINVILKEDSSTSYYAEITGLYVKELGFNPDVLLSANHRSGGTEYSFSYNYDVWPRQQDQYEERKSSNSVLEEIRDLNREQKHQTHTLTVGLNHQLANNDVISLNGFYQDQSRRSDNKEGQFSASDGNLLAQESLFIEDLQKSWEIGGDYETRLGSLGKWKTIFVATRKMNDDAIIQDEITALENQRLFTFDEDATQTEQIIRTNLTLPLPKGQSFEFGGEAAFNTLAASQSFDFSAYEYSKIEEDRFELFVTHSMPITPKMNLQTSLNRESSEIKQDSLGVNSERDFSFWKPRVELRYDIDKNNQIRLVADKSASQLNLRNFVAKRDTDDDTIDLGNPLLVPETIWRYSIAYEHRFADDAGTLELEMYQDNISNYISNAPLANGGTGIGNIGDAKRNGLNLELNSKLDAIGIDNAIVSVTYRYRDTETTDPFLQEARRLNGTPRHSIVVDFRHELRELNLAYGIDGHWRDNMNRQDITISEIRKNNIHISRVYLEYNFSSDTRLRAEIRQAFGDKKFYDRTFYTDNIINQDISLIENRATEVEPTYALKLQTSF